ncbi:MAG: LTA synthase family protein [Peptococcaceae bacterium]|nr:LTA synthase family protein [Peptococcaceae bacterium]
MLRINLYAKKIGKSVGNNQDFLLVTVAILLKIILFSVEIGPKFSSAELIISSVAILLVLTSGFILLPYKARTSLLLVFDLIISVGMLADLLFFRFFHSVITVPVLFEASQVEGVSSSVMTLFHPLDSLLFADLLVLVPYFVYLNKRYKPQPRRFFRRLGQIALMLVICGLVLNFTTKNVQAQFTLSEYTGQTWNQTVLRDLGVVNFHLLDVYSYIKQNGTKQSLSSAVPELKAWMNTHRQQGGTNLTGIAKGKNVIIVQLEAMQNFVVGQSVDGQVITPNLNSLAQNSIYFDNYFTQIGQGNTSDAEFMTLNSLYPASSGSNYVMKSNNTFQSLPWVLDAAGYQGSYAFHAYLPDFWNRAKMYQAEGFNQFYNADNFFKQNDTVGMGLSDESMFNQVIPQLKQLQQPYFSFVITLSGHYPYTIPSEKQTLKIPQGQYSETFTNYLQAQHYADQALGDFINQLKQQGILDNSVLVVYGDHYGSGFTNQDLTKFLGAGKSLNNYNLDELNKVPLIIHLPGNQAARVDHISGGQMDLYPTLLNLLGINNKDQYYFGQDLLNAKEGFSAFRVWAPDGSFATNDVFYIANWDGNFADGSAYDRKTGQKISLQGLQGYYTLAETELHASDLVLQTDGLPQLVPLNHTTKPN